jgi:CheY-like chemotaxis protein
VARILVVDDRADERNLVQEMLVSTGHEVVCASNGREALQQQRANSADLIITDLFMPELDGVETILALRHEFPSVKIVAMSGNVAGDTMLSVARRLGAVEVLEKPFTLEQLLTAVAKALG